MSFVSDFVSDIGGAIGDFFKSDLGKVAMVAAPMMFGMPPGLDMSELGAGEAGMFSAGSAGPGLGAFGSAGDMFGGGVEFGSGAASLGDKSLWEQFKGLPWKNIATGVNVGSGLFGLYQGSQMQDLAKRSFQAQDPFGPQRGQYQQQLQGLMADPSSVTKMPGYQFGLDQGRTALQRAGAASGSGGNEAIALAQYTPQYAQNFYNDEIKRLMALSGANIGPSTGNPLAAFGGGADIYARALAQLSNTAATMGKGA